MVVWYLALTSDHQIFLKAIDTRDVVIILSFYVCAYYTLQWMEIFLYTLKILKDFGAINP